MDLALFIKTRLEELGLEQKGLAASAQVTESYISQLLARKKIPPSAGRTGIYARMSAFLKLPEGELSKLADLQRRERLKRIANDQLKPLHPQPREILLATCASARQREVRLIFERDSYGELERLVTQTFLHVAQTIARDLLGDEVRVRELAKHSGRSPRRIRAQRLEFLRTEPFNIANETGAWFLAALLEWWDVDLKTFRIDLIPNRKLVPWGRLRFEFLQTKRHAHNPVEPGFQEFLADKSLSGDATEEELSFLRTLTLGNRNPTRIYYYRQLQNLRDPLNFTSPNPLPSSNCKKD